MGCLDLMRSIASIEDVQSEMGSMGAIPIMLSFIADADVHPLNIRQSAVMILSLLCHEHPGNKVMMMIYYNRIDLQNMLLLVIQLQMIDSFHSGLI
jgi:hypothetical protein